MNLSAISTAVSVSLENQTATGADIGTDVITNIERVAGGSGEDQIVGDSGSTNLSGGDGNDTVSGGGGADELDGGAGDDRVVIDAADVSWGGSDGHDTLVYDGDEGFNYAIGADSFEAIESGGGNDTLFGEDGENNWMHGGAGGDFIQSFAGNDTLIGGAGADELLGGDGDDEITIDVADIYWEGAAGLDTLVYDGNEDFSYALNQGSFEAVRSGGGHDSFYGSSNGDHLHGGGGDDVVFGYEGADTLIGGVGDDFLTGGLGADVFVFTSADGFDWIDDFVVGEDKIDLSAVAGIDDFADVLAISNDWGGGTTWITFDTENDIRLEGIPVANLNASDFIFA